MGTNYYSVARGHEERPDLWDCRDDPEVLHIGKSSVGWCFALHVIPEMGINDLDDWVPIFIDPERVIIDEYREPVELLKMMATITARRWPSGLRRHDVGSHCSKQGAGTWDCILGRFS